MINFHKLLKIRTSCYWLKAFYSYDALCGIWRFKKLGRHIQIIRINLVSRNSVSQSSLPRNFINCKIFSYTHQCLKLGHYMGNGCKKGPMRSSFNTIPAWAKMCFSKYLKNCDLWLNTNMHGQMSGGQTSLNQFGK